MKNIMSFNDACKIASSLKQAILSITPHAKIEFAGSLRREDKNIGDIDVLVDIPLEVLNNINGLAKVSGGQYRATYSWKGMQIDVWLVENNAWGSMLFVKTGPVQYIIAYAKIAQKLGFKLSPKGLISSSGQIIAHKTEHEIFSALGKQFKEPKLRGK